MYTLRLQPFVFVLLGLLLGLPQFTLAQRVDAFVFHVPPRNLEGVQRIAVVDFDSRGNREASLEAADQIIRSLLNDRRGIGVVKKGLLSKGESGITFQTGVTTRVFSVIERQRLNRILKELRLSASDLVDPNKAVRVGKLVFCHVSF